MGILGSLKDRILHKKQEDFYDFRSQITGKKSPFDEPNEPEPLEPLPTRSSFQEEPDFSEPVIQRSKLKDLTVEPPPQRFGFERETSRDYDILDKLSMIEAQLSAIRSQTETINERLKNLELRIGSRRI